MNKRSLIYVASNVFMGLYFRNTELEPFPRAKDNVLFEMEIKLN